MTKTKKIQYAGLAALALMLPAASSMADAYVKQGPGGNLLTNAFQTPVVNYSLQPVALTEIDGTFSTSSANSTAGIPDLFAIDITGLTPFSATTAFTNNSVFSAQLFLFDSTGHGIYFNDVDPSQLIGPGTLAGAGATLPADFLPVGEYYLGVATEGNAPQSTLVDANGNPILDANKNLQYQNIFPYPATDGSSMFAVDGPTGPGGAGPLSRWNTTSDDVETGSYQILLTGAAPTSVVPEASPLALLAFGGLLLAAVTLRRRSSSQV